jgi:predicted alpha-1,2-mannosidase
MFKKIIYFICTFSLAVVFASCHSDTSGDKLTPVRYVNPFIGTAYFAHDFPGPALPFAMVHMSPDMDTTGWNYEGGYYWFGKSMEGFSMLHDNSGGGDILLMPTVGVIKTYPGPRNAPDRGYRSRFSHNEENASPGYYEVMLKDYHIKVELTATRRVGLQKYIFPKTTDANILIDLQHGVRNPVRKAHVEIIPGKNEIVGYRQNLKGSKGFGSKVYFVIQFNKSFPSFGTWNNHNYHRESKANKTYPYKTAETGKHIGAFVRYHTAKNEAILVKVGISFVSIKGAKKNIAKEIPGWNFKKVKKNARKIWNKQLSKITVKGGTKKQKQIFYTALYHTLLYQYIFNDVDGKYFGMDGKVHKESWGYFYPKFQAWDAFRGEYPLMTLIEPQHVPAMMKSIAANYKHFGWLPGQHARNVYSQDMIGDHLDAIIATAYMNGIRGYDIQTLYKAMRQKALHYPKNGDSSIARSGLKYYKKLGYIPANRVTESASKTLEYSYDDWCIAQLAKKLGKKKDYRLFKKREEYYRNLYDPSTGFMRPKLANSQWLKKCGHNKPKIVTDGYNHYYSCFDPLWVGAMPYRHYAESNAWQYLWFMPQDVQGLINLMGGEDKFIHRLDHFFTMRPEIDGPEYIGVVGTIGQYVHGNEPDQQVPYYYDYAGVPWKTQRIVRKIMCQEYSAGPGGISGNEDAGAMSAWYVFSAMGFFPVSPGRPSYEIGSPIFRKVTIHLNGDKTFVIRAKHVSATNKYIQSAKLNDKPLNKPWITQSDIVNGDTLTFIMGDKPNKKWGSKAGDAPPSLTTKQ